MQVEPKGRMYLFLFCTGLLVLAGMLPGCQSHHGAPDKAKTKQPDTVKVFQLRPDVLALTADFRPFWNYWYDSIDLTRDFLPLNTKGETLSKLEFLKQLHTGRYMPVITRIERPDRKDFNQDIYTYQLLRVPSSCAPAIKSTIVQLTGMAIHDYKMEGKPLPDFNLTAIDGKRYTNESCKGRIVVIDTWFVHCSACVFEMPELNKWVYQNKDRKDVLFLSFCLDNKSTIEKFLQKQGFAFNIVADARDYIEQKLEIQQFPTKILVDKSGKIVRIGSYASIRREMEKLAGIRTVAAIQRW